MGFEMFRLEFQFNVMFVLFMFISTSSRLYRACLQRTLVSSLLTGALLEATAALGSRSAVPYAFPQGPTSHAVLKGGCYTVLWVSKQNVFFFFFCILEC